MLDLVDDSLAEAPELFADGSDGGAGGAEVAHKVYQTYSLAVRQRVPITAHNICMHTRNAGNLKIN